MKKRPKYGNRKTEVDGYLFDSAAEALRYRELKLLEAAGEITRLVLQPKFQVEIEGRHICDYFADFSYWDGKTSNLVVEDVKSEYTAKLPMFLLKKNLVEALYPGIKITVVQNG